MAKKSDYRDILNNRKGSFETQVNKFVVDTEEKMVAVMRDAIQNTVQTMQKPVAKGGKMRVKTGFLRSSGAAQIGSVPSGQSSNPDQKHYSWNTGNLETTLAKMKLGDTFFWGWTANYAKYREAYDGFMEAALQNWQKQVDLSVRKLKKAMKK